MNGIDANRNFPTETYAKALVDLLDAVEYNDTNYNREDRVRCLHYAYTRAIKHFTQPSHRKLYKASPQKIQRAVQTITGFVVYSFAKLSIELLGELTIYFTYMILLDDDTYNPVTNMMTWYDDLLAGRPQKDTWWAMVNDHLPNLLQHYGPFCSLNIVRSTIDFYEGCWIEQHNFQGFRGSYDYPGFLRRMTSLGHVVGGSLFPKVQFDEEKIFNEITSIIAQIEPWEVWVNDLMSFYKEFDEARDQTCLVNNYAHCNGVTIAKSLEKLVDDTVSSTEQLRAVFDDKDPAIAASLRAFYQGYTSFHLWLPRYKLETFFESIKGTNEGAKLQRYRQRAAEIGTIDDAEWAYPWATELI